MLNNDFQNGNSYNFNDIKLLTDDTLVKPTLNNIINELIMAL